MNEYTELAAVLLGLEVNEIEDWEWDEVEEKFEDKYGIALGEIEDLLNDLLQLVVPQAAPLSGQLMQFFGVEDKDNPGIWTAILRRKYTPVPSA